MTRTSSLDGVLLLCLAASPSAAYGQGSCTIRTIVGTYAFNYTGSSSIITAPPADGFHWNASHGPVAGAGVITVKPDGTASGSYWLIAGGLNIGSPLNSRPLHATFTIEPDCTGLIEYSEGMSEQVLVLDNGNEIRGVSARTGVPTVSWISVYRRVGGACNQNKLAGTYVFSCKTLINVTPELTISSASLIRMNIARDGSATGVFMGKFGPQVVFPFPVTGNLKLNGDCTAEGTLDYGTGQSVARGVFFNEGREGYWLPLVNNPGGQQPYAYCDIKQIENR